MLPFRVIQIEQHRALQQNAAKLYLPNLSLATLPSERKLTPIPDSLSDLNFAVAARRKIGLLRPKNEPLLQSACTTFNRHKPKSRCYRKQTTKPSPTGARTHIRELQKLRTIAQ